MQINIKQNITHNRKNFYRIIGIVKIVFLENFQKTLKIFLVRGLTSNFDFIKKKSQITQHYDDDKI